MLNFVCVVLKMKDKVVSFSAEGLLVISLNSRQVKDIVETEKWPNIPCINDVIMNPFPATFFML